MNFNQVLLIMTSAIMIGGISARKSDRSTKTRHRGKSKKKDDVTQASIETLHHDKFANQRKLRVDDVISFACLPEKTDRLVYRYENKTHIFIGFDRLENTELNVMTWKIKDKRAEILERRAVQRLDAIKSKSVRKRLKVSAILSATNSHLEKRFNEDMNTCETSVTSKYCLIQAFASLAQRMKSVTFHADCFKPVINR